MEDSRRENSTPTYQSVFLQGAHDRPAVLSTLLLAKKVADKTFGSG